MIRNPHAITAASFAAMFFLGVGYSIIGAAARNLGLTPAEIGILLAVQNVGFGVSVAVSGVLADTHPKPVILAVGSAITAIAFFAFFTTTVFWINALVMVFVGVGTGAFEGVADAMLFDLHERRAATFVNANHLFVTIGSALIAVYLIFLSLQWRTALVQAGIAVAILAVIFALVRKQQVRGAVTTFGQKVAAIGRSRLILVLFLAIMLSAGVEGAAIGLISTYLADLRAFAPLAAQLGLIAMYAGMITGRVIVGALVRPERLRRMMLALFALSVASFALLFLVDLGPLTWVMAVLAGASLSAQLPLILSYAGLAHREMTGTVLGAVKTGIPIGGVIIPLLVTTFTTTSGFAVALWVLPLGLLAGLILLSLPVVPSKISSSEIAT
jgi:FSR family fosmidomycin resistance protein-like MFS transporter